MGKENPIFCQLQIFFSTNKDIFKKVIRILAFPIYDPKFKHCKFKIKVFFRCMYCLDKQVLVIYLLLPDKTSKKTDKGFHNKGNTLLLIRDCLLLNVTHNFFVYFHI